MRYMYPAIFTENELDGYSVQFVDFENGYTCGDDMEDAVAMAAEVLWLLIDDYLQLDKPLPKPTYPICLLYTSPSPRDRQKSRMPSSA